MKSTAPHKLHIFWCLFQCLQPQATLAQQNLCKKYAGNPTTAMFPHGVRYLQKDLSYFFILISIDYKTARTTQALGCGTHVRYQGQRTKAKL